MPNFEWRRDEGRKIKTRIHNISGNLFAMAGLTDGDNFTIVTMVPAAAIAHIHSRMPVIIDANSEASWLDPELEFPPPQRPWRRRPMTVSAGTMRTRRPGKKTCLVREGG